MKPGIYPHMIVGMESVTHGKMQQVATLIVVHIVMHVAISRVIPTVGKHV
jgi:hypothetical protein